MPTDTTENSPRDRQAVFVVMVALITFACFLPAVPADFVRWDDDVNIYENEHIQGLSWENLRWMFADVQQALRYKPLSWLAWAVIYEIGGLEPAGFHFANVLLHTINAVLAYLLFSALLPVRAGVGVMRVRICAAVGALVWSLHPLRVEPVAWATGLPYDLSLMFGLTAMLLYWRFVTGADAWSYRGSVVCFVLGLLAYPLVLGLAVVPVAMDRWLAAREGKTGPWLRRRHALFLIAAGLMVALNVVGRLTPNATYVEAASLLDHSVFDRAMQGFYGWTYFLFRHVWTAGLSFMYFQLIDFDPMGLSFVASAVFVVTVSMVLFGARLRLRVWWLLWGCHLAWLVPVLGLTEDRHSPADRYTYASGLLVGLLVAIGLYRLAASERWRMGLLGAAGALVLFASQTSALIPIWRDTGTLYRHGLPLMKQAEQRSEYATHLGHWHLLRGEYPEAEVAYRIALSGAADAAELHFRVAHVLHGQNRFAEALPHYEIAFEADKLADEFIGDYGIALVAVGRIDEAEARFAEAVRRAPSDPRHRYNWALTLKKLGRAEEASEQEAEARRLAEAGG